MGAVGDWCVHWNLFTTSFQTVVRLCARAIIITADESNRTSWNCYPCMLWCWTSICEADNGDQSDGDHGKELHFEC